MSRRAMLLGMIAVLIAGMPGCKKGRELNPAQKRQKIIREASADSILSMGIEHLEAVFTIMENNRDDCRRTLRTVNGYTEEQGPEIQLMGKRLKELKESMTPAQKDALKQAGREKTDKLMKRAMAILMEFSQKCPEEAARLSKSFEVFRAFTP